MLKPVKNWVIVQPDPSRTLVNFDKPEINLAIGDQYVDGTTYHNDFAAAGFFGRINYDYMGKYLLEVNARYDGSSKFPSGDPMGSVSFCFCWMAFK